MAIKLHVGSLSWNTTSEGLSQAFGAFGQILDATVISDSISGRSRGFGFVTFADPRDAKSAIRALHGSSLDGQVIEVQDADEQSAKATGGGTVRRW